MALKRQVATSNFIRHVYSPQKVSKLRTPIFASYKKTALVLGVVFGVLIFAGAAMFLTKTVSSELPSWVELCFAVLCVVAAFASMLAIWIVRNQELAALECTDYENAGCSSDSDRRDIDKEVNENGGFARLNEHINELRIEQFKDLGFRFDRWFVVLGVMVIVLVMLLCLSN